jgi:hypothetical protein
MQGIWGFGSMLGHEIINGCPIGVRVSFEVVGVESGGLPYG